MLVLDRGRLAFNHAVDIVRPRDPGSPEFAQLRRDLLGRLGVDTTRLPSVPPPGEPDDHTNHRPARARISADDDIELVTDVLVIGGGPAGTWAAIKAREAGADVLLVDKGYCGTSGATAAAGTGVWFVPPLAEAREQAMASREGMNGWLSDRRWMRRVLDETYRRVPELDVVSYPFPVDDAGEPERGGLQGPDYMKRQRRRVIATGARILDHSPVLELLVDADGSVAGRAACVARPARRTG